MAVEAGADTKVGVDTKVAVVVAKGGTKIKGIRTKTISRGTITTTKITNSKDTIMTIITTMETGGTNNKALREEHTKAKGVTNLLPREEANP